jgi:GT2 family glycosyltransferase
MLESLSVQSVLPARVVVVAAGTQESSSVVNEFPKLDIQYIHLTHAGTSWQRNAGLKAMDASSTLVGFLDDDVVLEPGALEAMLAFWEDAPPDLGGAGFNFRNVLAPETQRKWSLRSPKRLYDKLMIGRVPKGKVLRSGFPTPVYPVTENTYVDWLETLGLVLRREVVRQFQFDDFYAGYSYLEHVDYTYTVSRKYRLCVVSNAWVTHYSGPIRNSYLLGKMQVINRIRFVRKHEELSFPRCYLTLLLHTFFNLAVGVLLRDLGYFKRAWGNCVGLAQVAVGRMAPVAGDVK